MVDFKYLYLGLCGMARAHQANAMAGHLGAAVVTGYFIGEELPDLDERVYAGIEKELNQIMGGGEAFWYDADKAGITIPDLFQPFPDETVAEVPDLQTKLATISTALAANIDTLREAGHNVIFSSIAIRALKDHPQYATDSIVGGIGKLIARFDDAGTGRGYYGKERGWVQGTDVELGDDTNFPAYRNQQEMVEVVIDELIQSAAIRRQGFGGLFHIINHAAAITELSRLGYGPLAVRGLPVHHQHVRLWRSLPDVENELGPLKAAQHDPRTPEYWQGPDSSQWSAQLTHRVKTIYGFNTILRFIESEAKRNQAREKFLYLMA